jgi:hypothetical protein
MQARASQVGRGSLVHAELAERGHGLLAANVVPCIWLPIDCGRRLSGVSLRWFRVSSLKQKRPRMAAAWFCLLAVALLHAPLAAAALLAYGVDCCVGGFCNVPEHHHHKQPPAPSQHSSPMDCGQDKSGMASCSISCCKDPARPALVPGAFLLPSLSFAPAAVKVLRSVQLTSSLEISRFVKPISPPPRFVDAVL